MFALIRSLLHRFPTDRPKRCRTALRMEHLEDRVLLSGNYFDSFETAALNSYWNLNLGTITLSTDRSHSGAQSVQLDPGEYIGHLAGTVPTGEVSAFFYSTGGFSVSDMFYLVVHPTNQFQAQSFRFGKSDSDYYAFVPGSGGPLGSRISLPISPTPGWHQLKIQFDESHVEFVFDGNRVYAWNGTRTMQSWLYYGRYVDDFAFRDSALPDINVLSAELVSGNRVQFTYETIGNPGPFDVAVYRSANGTTYNPADRINVTIPPVTPNPQTAQQTPVSFTLPTSWVTDPSKPYLIVVADPNNAITESDEGNNKASLLLRDIAMQSAQLVAGNRVQFTYATAGNPGPFDVGLYRSTDGITINPADRIATQTVSPGAAGTQPPGTFNLSSPYVMDPTLPYLIVVADPLNAIAEADEDNNVAIVPITTDIRALSATTEDSQSVIVEYEILQGDLTQPLEIQIFRSVDPLYDTGDIAASSVVALATTELDLNGQPVGAVGQHRVKVTAPLPLSLTPSHPYVVAVLDPQNKITELQEQNNEWNFRKRVLGVVTHGLVNPSVWPPAFATLPPWVKTLTNFLEVGRGYDRAVYIDWADSSNDRRPHAAEEAGQRMANLVNDQFQQMKQFFPEDIIDIHMIGHSRGSVVISQAAQRLESTPFSPRIHDGFVQMTLLDPHPAYNSTNLALGIAEVLDPINIDGISTVGQFSFNRLFGGRVAALEVLRAQSLMDDPLIVIPAYVDKSESFYQRTLARNVGGAYGYFVERALDLWGWVTPVAQPHEITNLVPGISHSGVVDWYMNLLGVSTPVIGPATPLFAAGAGPGGGSHVKVYNADGSERFGFFAYDAGYTGGVTVATGDVTGDGVDDIVTGTQSGGAPHVKVFDGATGIELASFLAFDAAFVGGVSVAVGDVNGDGFADIAVGAGAGGGPHVKVFSGLDGSELMSFFAYDAGFQGGVSVAVAGGDIITGALAGGAPHVKVFAGMTGEVKRSFFAFDPKYTGGVNVAAGDLNGDGAVDFLVGQASGGTMMTLDGASGDEVIRTPFDGFLGGISVTVKDLNDDGTADMLMSATAVGARLASGQGRLGSTAPIPGAPRVRGLSVDGNGFFDFFAFDPAFGGGASVG